MTETREQWIEREARKARVRCGYDDWDSRNELTRDVWRNVVAPFYQEPVRVPVDVDGLARAMYETPDASGGVHKWDEATEFTKKTRIAEVATALDYLNIEPCAKPEYDPADVAFRDTLKKSQEIVNNWTPEQRNHNSIGYVGLQDNERAELENLRVECKRLRHEVEVERDRANDLLADRDSVVNIRDKTIKAICEEYTKLRVEASDATAKAERQRQALDANRKTIESRGAEIARLENEVKRLRTQQPETRPVKVRFDVTAEDLAAKIHHALHGGWPELSQEGDRTKAVWIDTAKIATDYLAAHAVLEVPPGVPSVKDIIDVLREHIGWYEGTEKEEDEIETIVLTGYDSAATAIQDAILAAMPQRREWSSADVEELAKVMYETSDADGDVWKWDDGSQYAKNTTRKEARAALTWFDGKRGEV